MSAYATDYLPASLREVVDIIGMQAALKLVEHFGGVALYVPAEITPDHRITQAIGERAATLLWEHYRGDTIDIPRCHAALREARNAELRARREAGATVSELAIDYGLTMRAVWYILAADDAAQSPQISLLS